MCYIFIYFLPKGLIFYAILRAKTIILKNTTHWYLTYVENCYFQHDVIAKINENNLTHIYVILMVFELVISLIWYLNF